MSPSPLFTPLTLRQLTLRNRIWAAPMCQYSVRQKDGVPRQWHLVHLGSLAAGGAGLVMAEATAVSAEGRISDEDTGLWNQAQRDAWRPIVDFIHSQGAAAGIQLAHAGRKASIYPEWSYREKGTMPVAEGGWQTVSASAVPFGELAPPVALDADGIQQVIDDFGRAAVRAVEAGFDCLELHAAHGYLLHQFLSPVSNQRTDGYGGDLGGRARLLLQIVAEVRDRIPGGMPLLVRFSATDYAPGGWDEQQTATVARWAADAGADLFDISSGGNVADAAVPIGPGYQVPFAQFVKSRAGVPVSAVGLITDAAQADAIVRQGQADAVMLGRELLRDPHFPLRAAHELGVDVDYWPPQYLRARWR